MRCTPAGDSKALSADILAAVASADNSASIYSGIAQTQLKSFANATGLAMS